MADEPLQPARQALTDLTALGVRLGRRLRFRREPAAASPAGEAYWALVPRILSVIVIGGGFAAVFAEWAHVAGQVAPGMRPRLVALAWVMVAATVTGVVRTVVRHRRMINGRAVAERQAEGR